MKIQYQINRYNNQRKKEHDCHKHFPIHAINQNNINCSSEKQKKKTISILPKKTEGMYETRILKFEMTMHFIFNRSFTSQQQPRSWILIRNHQPTF